MANYTENTKKNTDLHQQMPAQILHLKWPVKVSNTTLWERDQAAANRKRNKEEKIEVDRTHTEKTNSKYHTTIACFEPPRKEKKRKAKKHLTETRKKWRKWPQTDKNGGPWSTAYAPSEQTGDYECITIQLHV